ncbi:MAG: hypothetical protein E6Q97_20915 [Desulfurellales bacterium]|nr:MAG: hypothetical protein E6Q97_20915 [Desulfurellales bacterium]
MDSILIDGQPARALVIGRRYVKAEIAGREQLISRQAWDAAAIEAARVRLRAEIAAEPVRNLFACGLQYALAGGNLLLSEHRKNKSFCDGYHHAKSIYRRLHAHENNPVPCNDNMGAPRRERKESSS